MQNGIGSIMYLKVFKGFFPPTSHLCKAEWVSCCDIFQRSTAYRYRAVQRQQRLIEMKKLFLVTKYHCCQRPYILILIVFPTSLQLMRLSFGGAGVHPCVPSSSENHHCHPCDVFTNFILSVALRTSHTVWGQLLAKKGERGAKGGRGEQSLPSTSVAL